MRKNFPGGSFSCAYEAGYSGFWIEEALRKEGVDCIVVNAADVPSKDKEKRYKTDRIDSRKIARCLRSGELEGIYCPSREELEDRSLLRTRQELVKQLTREIPYSCSHRILHLLKNHNMEFMFSTCYAFRQSPKLKLGDSDEGL